MNTIIVEDIEVEVVKKNIKNMNLSVHQPDGRVRLSVPRRVSEENTRLFIISKLGWIKKHRERIASKSIETPKEFVSHESHYLFGNAYTLNIIESKSKQRVEIQDNYINLYVRPRSTIEKREKIMSEWYRENLKNVIPKYIKKWEDLIGVTISEWRVKLMKTRWGTCNIRDKRIWINLELAKKDLKFLDYIVVHEIVHLLERNHNDKFKSHMDIYLPNWREIQDELNGLN